MTAGGPAGALGDPRRHATLKDVARVAGVSVQTVSNVLHGTGRFSKRTRREVLEAVAELGYRSHLGAASLRSGRANRLAYPLPDDLPGIDTPILLEFLRHLVVAADRRHQQLLVMKSESGDVRAIDEAFRSRSVDGVVLTSIVAADGRVAHLASSGVPFACFGRPDDEMPQAWVDVDNRAAVRGVTEWLLARGHDRPVFLGYDTGTRWDLERESGYVEAMQGAAVRPHLVLVRPQTARDALAALLRSRERPSAVIAGSDVLAAACYTAARDAGLDIGSDLAVTGFDGSAVSKLLVPSLTTVEMPLATIADRVVARILGETPNDVGELVPTALVIGDSTGP